MQDNRVGRKIGNYLLERPIGKGQYGQVYYAKGEHDGKEYAVKCIQKSVIF